MCLVQLNIGITSGTTHIKTIFSLSPGTDKNFIGNALCSSDDSITQLIHILYVFTINSAFYKPHNKKSRGVKSEERGVQGVGLPPPPLLSNNWETPCTQTHEHDGRSRVVHHLTGKLFHRT